MQGNPSAETCHVCGKAATIHIHKARNRKWVEVQHVCQGHVNEVLSYHLSLDRVVASVERSATEPGTFDIELLIVRSDGPEDGVYYLREQDGSRRFSATMGYCESAALYLNVQRSTTSRPCTHAAFAATISAMGGKVQDVLIDEFMEAENCFRAFLRIRSADELIKVDVRPSDAINLAVVCSVPILVSAAIPRI